MVLPTIGTGALVLVSAAVVTADDEQVAAAPQTSLLNAPAPEEEAVVVSRSGERPSLDSGAEAAEKIQGQLWVATSTDIRADAAPDAPVLAQVEVGSTVDVTGEEAEGWTQVIHNGLPRWVESATLSESEPLAVGPCPLGSGVESGLQPDTIKVYRAVCAKFPSVTTYGGLRGDGEHGQGRALDVMVTGATGDQIAEFLRANWRELGVSEVIWQQRIWTVQLAGSGWRPMEDRGSATANHFDHVHVTTFGNSATN